jgi:hypothetical protein
MQDSFWLISAGLWSVLFGGLGTVIANSRGVSAFDGFILGLFLGPFGLIGIYFIGGEEAKREKLLASAARRACPYCAELVRPEAKICPHCKEPVNVSSPS